MHVRRLLPLFVTLTAAACDLQVASPTTSVSQRVVASQGGIVCTPDQRAHVNVPAGALAADTTITIDPVAAPDAAKTWTIVGDAWEFGPNGTTFATPAMVTVTYDPARLAGAPIGSLAVLAISHGASGDVVEELPPVAVDSAASKISAMTSHFTTFLPVLSKNATSGKIVTINDRTVGEANPTYLDFNVSPTGTVTDVDTQVASSGLSFTVDTQGFDVGKTMQIDTDLEDPAGYEPFWFDFFNAEVVHPLVTANGDANGKLFVWVDGKALALALANRPPGYPSGRLHMVFHVDQDPTKTVELRLSIGAS